MSIAKVSPIIAIVFEAKLFHWVRISCNVICIAISLEMLLCIDFYEITETAQCNAKTARYYAETAVNA